MREAVRRTLGGVGRTLITVGLLILAFVVYQLWGTGWFTARQQANLKDRFRQEVARRAATTTTTRPGPAATTATSAPGTRPGTEPVVTPGTTPPGSTLPDAEVARIRRRVQPGDPIGIMRLPWGNYAIVEGTAREDLKKGPGHYPDTPFPGQLGNAAIAGHRTTYLHPFYDLDTLKVGQTITVDMLWGRYVYRIATAPFAVAPTDTYIARTGARTQADPARPDTRPASEAWLTLTTCNPKYSARQRLIVQAKLVVAKSPKPAAYTPPARRPARGGTTGSGEQASSEQLRQGLEGDPQSRGPATLWGVFVALAGGLWWWVYRHWRHPLTWLAGGLAFLPVLVGFYVYLERVLPSNY